MDTDNTEKTSVVGEWSSLDRLDIELAVLDRDGVIVAVNDAWARFAQENGGNREACCEGVSYLAVCRGAADGASTVIAAAIHAAGNGELLAPFSTRVACHTPRQPRWFDVTVAGRRAVSGEPAGALISVTPAPVIGPEGNAVADGLVGPGFPEVASPLPDHQLRQLIDASPDGLALVDHAGQFLFVNNAFEATFGYGHGELLGHQVELLVPSSLAPVHRAHRVRYRAEATARQMGPGMEIVGRRRDGSEIPIEVTLSPLHLADRLRVVVAVRHHTFDLDAGLEQRIAIRALDAVDNPVLVFHHDSLEFSYANLAAARHLGYSRRELLSGMTPAHVLPDITPSQLRSQLSSLAAGHQELTIDTVHLSRDGERLGVEIRWQHITGVDERAQILAVIRIRPEE